MGRIEFSKNSRMICAPLMAESVDQMLNGMHQAKMEGADVAEITLDIIRPPTDLKLLLQNKPIPVVVAFRYVSLLILVPNIVVSRVLMI